jgi:hypothetical protein
VKVDEVAAATHVQSIIDQGLPGSGSMRWEDGAGGGEEEAPAQTVK